MNSYYLFEIPLLICAALPVITGSIRLKALDTPFRYIYILVLVDFITELAAYFSAKIYHNNMVIYNVSNYVQIFLTALYFNYTITFFRKRNIGIYIGVFSVFVGLLNNIFFEAPTTYNSNFFLYQAIIVFLMSSFLYMQFMMSVTYLQPWRSPHFWFVIALLFFNTFNILTMALYPLILGTRNISAYINDAISICADLTNIGFALVFIFYSKNESEKWRKSIC